MSLSIKKFTCKDNIVTEQYEIVKNAKKLQIFFLILRRALYFHHSIHPHMESHNQSIQSQSLR